LLMVLFVKPGHVNTFKYTNLIYSGQQCACAGMTICHDLLKRATFAADSCFPGIGVGYQFRVFD